MSFLRRTIRLYIAGLWTMEIIKTCLNTSRELDNINMDPVLTAFVTRVRTVPFCCWHVRHNAGLRPATHRETRALSFCASDLRPTNVSIQARLWSPVRKFKVASAREGTAGVTEWCVSYSSWGRWDLLNEFGNKALMGFSQCSSTLRPLCTKKHSNPDHKVRRGTFFIKQM